MSTVINMEAIGSRDIDDDFNPTPKTSEKSPLLTFKNIKKWVKYISYALILLLTFYTIFSNILIKNEDTKKLHDSKVDGAIKALFKVVQLTNGMPMIGELSEDSNIDDISNNIDRFINVLSRVTTTEDSIP